MRRGDRPIPTFESEAEEQRLRESHDFTDCVDWSRARAAAELRASTTSIPLRLPVSLLERIKVAAHKRDVPYQALIETRLAEKFDSR